VQILVVSRVILMEEEENFIDLHKFLKKNFWRKSYGYFSGYL